jgi:thiol-disulfide isomerase/thioredoxin
MPARCGHGSGEGRVVGKANPRVDRTQGLNGRTIILSQFKRKVVLLDFWAVDCGGCQVEIPWYVAFDTNYRDKGLALIGIDMYGESPKVVKTFMKKTHMNYQVAIGNVELGKRFHVEEVPLTLLIYRNGRVARMREL